MLLLQWRVPLQLCLPDQAERSASHFAVRVGPSQLCNYERQQTSSSFVYLGHACISLAAERFTHGCPDLTAALFSSSSQNEQEYCSRVVSFHSHQFSHVQAREEEASVGSAGQGGNPWGCRELAEMPGNALCCKTAICNAWSLL